MVRISKLLTVAPARLLWRHEIDHALHVFFGAPIVVSPFRVWGSGAAHAFGRDESELATTPIPPSGRELFEVLLLAGVGHEHFVAEERARHVQERDFAESQSSYSVRLARSRVVPADRRQRLRLQALTDFQSDMIPALIGAGITPEQFDALGADGLEQFVAAVPTIWALTELRRMRFANPAQRFTDHDLNDLRALAPALVYCDVVVADKAWCSAIARTDLQERFKTVVINDVAELEDMLVQRR
jgi:hypothetical protein